MFCWMLHINMEFNKKQIYCKSCHKFVQESCHPLNHQFCYTQEDMVATFEPASYVMGARNTQGLPDSKAYEAELLRRFNTAESLINALKHDPLSTDKDYRTQCFLIFALGDTWDERAVIPLVRLLLEASEYRVRYAAAYALAKLGVKIEDPEIIQQLIGTLGDARKYGKMRDFIVWVLLQTDEGKTAAPLIQFLKENYVKIEHSQCHLWTKEVLTNADLKLGYNFKTEFTIVESDHFKRIILKCDQCGQLYFYEFLEIDNFGEDDDQYSTFIPIEMKDVPELSKLSSLELLAITPRLQWDSGQNIRWVKEEEDAK